MGCRGLCEKHKSPRSKTGKRYIEGQKRCQICAIFIIWSGIHCPCCGFQLRTRPRNSQLKKIFAKSIPITEE